MKLLKYKGILFDDYTFSEDGACWGEICSECVDRYFDVIRDEIDDGGTACGCCSVKGCFNVGDADEVMHYYIDFAPENISFEGVIGNDCY